MSDSVRVLNLQEQPIESTVQVMRLLKKATRRRQTDSHNLNHFYFELQIIYDRQAVGTPCTIQSKYGGPARGHRTL